MLDADPSFRPVRRRDGYLPLEDMGLIGDGTTSALVGLDGSIPWLCLPRFDSEPLFCGLLDAARGGSFTVAPDEVIEARQRYEHDTAVLVTELQGPTGLLAVTDALALRPGADLSDDAPDGRRELIRSAVALDGSVRVREALRCVHELHAELGEERFRSLEVFDNDEDVVHPFERHCPSIRGVLALVFARARSG